MEFFEQVWEDALTEPNRWGNTDPFLRRGRVAIRRAQ